MKVALAQFSLFMYKILILMPFFSETKEVESLEFESGNFI
jgi:hypothetical protein